MEVTCVKRIPSLSQSAYCHLYPPCSSARVSLLSGSWCQQRFICIEQHARTQPRHRNILSRVTGGSERTAEAPSKSRDSSCAPNEALSLRWQLFQAVASTHQKPRRNLGIPAFPSTRNYDSHSTFTRFVNNNLQGYTLCARSTPGSVISWKGSDTSNNKHSTKGVHKERYREGPQSISLAVIPSNQSLKKDHTAFEGRLQPSVLPHHYSATTSKNSIQIEAHKEQPEYGFDSANKTEKSRGQLVQVEYLEHEINSHDPQILMTPGSSKTASETNPESAPAQHRPLVVGLTKPSPRSSAMASSEEAAALNHEIQKNLSANTKSAGPADDPPSESSQTKQKKEKAPKQPKAPKAAPAAAPTSPALIDLRVGHILRAIAHPNADSLYVSTIAMGDAEGTEHTQVDEETGKVVRTVCSGLNGLVPLAEMQDRKIIVVANLKPVNMRSIKSAAMVLAASPKQEAGADPHAPDRVVELVMPPEGSEAGDKVYFESWPYGDGKGPEKQLNPKKKQWEAIQPGFYTGEDLTVGFDAGKCEEVEGSEKGRLVVEGKGVCTVKTLKGAVVR